MEAVDSRDEEAPLIVDEVGNSLSTKAPKKHLRDVHILCAAFLLIFLAYVAAQNLESSLNTEEALGTTSLGILYSSFTLFSLSASFVVRFLGSKNALILGTTGYWLFIAANLRPTWYTMIPASVYLGFSASIIWVGQGTYLTSMAHSHAHDYNLQEVVVIGRFNGEFWAVFACTQVVGNLFTLALLRDGTEGATSGTTLLFVVFLSSMTLGTILMCFLQKLESKGDDNHLRSSESLCASVIPLLKSMITPLLNVRILLIVPLMVYSGLQQAFVWAEFTKYIVTPKLGVSGVGATMAVYGVSNAVFSLASGRLTSGLKSITFIVSGGIFAHAIVFLWILLKYSVTSGLPGVLSPFLMAALLAMGDGVFVTQLNALIGIMFKHDMEGGFSHMKVWQNAPVALVFFLSPYISLAAMVWILLSGLCVSYGGFLILTVLVEKAFSSSSL